MEQNSASVKKSKHVVRRLVECAVMVAAATALSMLKFDLPFGGGVTVVSMLPIILISHRHGLLWGLGTAFVYSLGQLLLGLDNVAYAQNFAQALGVIFLDYIIAFTVLGLSGLFDLVFRRRKKATAIGIAFARRIPMTREQNIRTSILVGIFVTFTLRFLCHYFTGAWIWGEWMPEEFMGMTMTSPWIYSALYNGWYMLAELVITELAAMLLYSVLGKFFRGDDLRTAEELEALQIHHEEAVPAEEN